MRKKKLLLHVITLCFIITGCISNNVLGMDNTSISKITDIFKAKTTFVNSNNGLYNGTFENNNYIFDFANIPEYVDQPYIELNNNIPSFTNDDLSLTSFETYSELDLLGRCGISFANIGKDIMPTEERGSIGMIKPSGWHTIKYDIVDGKYLYNRCHLIGYQLSGENANEKNLITGTRYMNIEGMLPFENAIAEYVNSTNNHVLYRATPIFRDNNLLARGVLLEAMSVEDSSQGIMFNVFCYNVQPGIIIDYSNGSSTPDKSSLLLEPDNSSTLYIDTENSFICNTNTYKFHLPDCPSVSDIKDKNKKLYIGHRESLITNGFSACKRCNP